ncbi:hypothetical protein DSO57_1024190 [Entomophthora muscae]|uniref:Uncharacterized protein n=1 Tax=Entomophthora muscae TaxID=34485 RepID=A0ACC2TPX2_9FUNG|nr:hypothetical protein DSO57_1024190 [Entomophthora muscae]
MIDSGEQFLKFGDVITITDEKNGLLVANDAVKNRAYVATNLDSSSRTKFASLAFLFQVQPPSSYQALRSYRKFVESEASYVENRFKKRSWKEVPAYSSQANSDSRSTFDSKGPSLEAKEVPRNEENIIALSHLVEQEKEQNANERARVQGKMLLYGQNIMLHNTLTDKYIQINPSETCENESNCLRVDFTENIGKTCIFKILPRYRVRVEGEPVRLGDSVVFKCLKTGGYISGGAIKFPHYISHNTVIEACSDNKPYSWKLTLFHHIPAEESTKVYAGQLIRLYHKEREAYLQTDPEHGHPYLQNFQVNPINPFETKDSSAFWRLEKENIFAGGLVKWGDKIRLRHPTSGSYLAVTTEPTLKIKGHSGLTVNAQSKGIFRMVEDLTYENLDCTLFNFFPVANLHTYLYVGSFVQIQHVASGLWLNVGAPLNQKKTFVNNGISDNSEAAPGQLEVVTSGEEQSENCFSVSSVEPEFVPRVNFIETLLPAINRFLITPRTPSTSPSGEVAKFPITEAEFFRMKRILVSLIYFCAESSELDPLERIGVPLADNQDLLRESGIVKKLSLILRLPFDIELRHSIAKDITLSRNLNFSDVKRPSVESVLSFEDLVLPGEAYLAELMTLTYKLIQQFLLGPNVANQDYLAFQLDTFWSHLTIGVRSAPAIVNLLKDNLSIIENVDESKITRIVEILPGIKGKDASYLDILSVLCGNEMHPMRRNQSLIMDRMLRCSLDRDLIYHTSINPKTQEMEVQVYAYGSAKKIRLDRFLSSQLSINNLVERKPVNGVPSSIHMQHQDSGPTQLVGEPTKIESRGPLRLNNRIRFFESTLKLFHAVSAGRNVDAIYAITHELRFLTFNNCMLALANKNLPYSVRAQYCYLMTTFFIDVPPLNQVTIDHSYSIEDMRNNSNNLNLDRLVSTSTSNSSPGELDNIYRSPSLVSPTLPDYATLFSKVQSPAITEFDKIHRFLTNFILDQSCANGRTPNPKARCLLAGVLRLIHTLIDFGFYVKYKLIVSLISNLLNILDSRHETSDSQYAYREGTQFIIEAKIEICGILKRLFEFRSHVRARKLLYQWRILDEASTISATEPKDGMEKLVRGIISESGYISPSRDLVPILVDLLKYKHPRMRSAALNLLYKSHSSYSDFLVYAEKMFVLTQPEHIRIHAWVKPRFTEFKTLISQHRTNGSAELEARIVQILEDFYLICSDSGVIDFNGSLVRHPDTGRRADVNHNIQTLFLNLEVHKVVLNYMQQHLRATQSYRTDGLSHNLSILLACSRFLELICRRRPQLQNEILLRNLDLLIEAIYHDTSIVNEFVDLFTNHQFVCLSITEAQVARILNLSRGHDGSPLKLLHSLLKVNGRVVKRNQNMISKLIVENRSRLLPTRLVSIEAQPGPLEVKYLVGMLELLSLCAEGDNGFSKALCQTMFLPQSLLNSATHSEWSLELRSAYLCLLTSAYVDNQEQPMQDIASNMLAWKLIQEANALAVRLQKPAEVDYNSTLFFMNSLLPFASSFYEHHYNAQAHIDTDMEFTSNLSDEFLENLNAIPRSHLTDPAQCLMLLRTIEKLAVSGGFSHTLRRQDLVQVRQGIERLKNASIGSIPLSAATQNSLFDLDETNAKLSEFVTRLRQNAAVSSLCEEEFHKLSANFQLQSESLATPPVYYLIQHLTETSGFPLDAAKEYIDNHSLKIIARLLVPTVKEIEATSHVDNPERFKALLRQRNEIQNELDNFGCTNMAEQLLSSDSVAISEAALELLVVLLSGGNRQVQNTLEDYFMGTRQERFFHFAHFSIRQSITTIEQAKQMLFTNRKHLRPPSMPVRTHTSRRKARSTVRLSSLKLEDERLRVEREAQAGTLVEVENDLGLLTSDREEIERKTKMMRLIQLFVEGHNFNLQNYLRNQPDNIKSFDLIKDIVDYFRSIVSIAHTNIIELIIQTIDTITELAQGCVKNQIHIFNCKIVQTVNAILRDSFSSHPTHRVLILKGKAIQCLLSLLEDFNEETRPVFEEMALLLDFQVILNNLDNLYQENYARLMSRQKTSVSTLSSDVSPNYSAAIDTGFHYTMILMSLFSYFVEEEQSMIVESPAYQFFKLHTGRIEILREISPGDRKLLPVLFPIPEICKYLADDVKHSFLWTVNRDSPSSKIQDLVAKSEDVIFMVKNRALVARSPYRLFLTENRDLWWKGAFAITLLLQLLMLVYVESPDDVVSSSAMSTSWLRTGQALLGTLHSTFWLLAAAEFSTIQLPNVVNHNRLLRLNGPLANLASPPAIQELEWLHRAMEYILEPRLLYHVGLAFLSLLGLIYPYIYAVHLLDFVYRDEILQGVIASITVNFHSLSRTALLGVVIIYIYSMIAFIMFQNSFDAEAGLFCDSLRSCFVTVLSHGMRAGGGLGELLAPPTRDGTYIYRVLLDVSFFLLVIIFLLNVIFGIIFDTFGRLRDERSSVLQDMRSICFICNIEASEFQRHSKGFEHHIHHDHNMWQYLSFLIHLNTKEVTEYNAHRSYVADMLAAKDLNFFPVNRALCLKDREEEKDEQLLQLETTIESMASKLDSISSQLIDLRFRMSAVHGAPSSPFSP